MNDIGANRIGEREKKSKRGFVASLVVAVNTRGKSGAVTFMGLKTSKHP